MISYMYDRQQINSHFAHHVKRMDVVPATERLEARILKNICTARHETHRFDSINNKWR